MNDVQMYSGGLGEDEEERSASQAHYLGDEGRASE